VVETPIGIIGANLCWEHAQPLITYAMCSMHEQIHVASWPGVKWNNPEIYNGDEAYLPYSRIYAMQTQTFTLVASGLIGEAAKEFFAGGDKEKEAIIGSSGGVAQIIDPEGNDLC